MNDRTRIDRRASATDDAARAAIALAGRVIAWTDGAVREVFREVAAEQIRQLDDEIDRLRAMLPSLAEDQTICFLGNSGVGKSTLINALVAGHHRVLPQGGIGPLTAQATSVRYAARPYFAVTYLPPRNLHRLAFGLEQSYAAKQEAAADAQSDFAWDLGDDDRSEAASEAGDSGQASERILAYQKQARLLIQGDQNGELDVPYLLDSLGAILGRARRWGTAPADADLPRIEQARACLARAKSGGRPLRVEMTEDPAAFFDQLREHVSGSLAPLIQTLEVGWDSDLLHNGLVLVDLPGLGVANDQYRTITHDWVRQRARAIVLVVDRSGVKEAEAELLRSSGFLSRLMFSADDPAADPVELILVVVKVDLSAYDAWYEEKQRAAGSAKPWSEHFAKTCRDATQLVTAQLAEQLRASAVSNESSIRGDVADVIERLLGRTEAHAVSALEYGRLLANDDDDRARIKAESESGVPVLQAALTRVAERRQTALRERVEGQSVELCRRLLATLEVIQAQWEGDARLEAEAQQLRSDLEAVLEPLRRELSHRQGAFREFLRESLPARIESLVAEAGNEAERDIKKYLGWLRDAHWATLRATVRKGGAFVGARHIDLPIDFALRFEEPVAVIWAKKILAELRRRTAELGSDYVEMVGDVVTWAEQQDTRVQPKLVRALRDKMEAEAKQLATVGKEKVDELRATVKNELLKRIQPPIRRRCQNFVESGKDQGTGTKIRILDLFDKLVPLVVDSAQNAATEILRGHFKNVELEIRTALKGFEDPLTAAANAIVSSHEERLRRSDQERRGRVLALVAQALADAPCKASSAPGEHRA